MTAAKLTTSILMFSPWPSVGGGVVEFTQTLTRNLDKRFKVDHFYIGYRKNSKVISPRSLVTLFDMFRLATLLLGRSHDLYHVNPSFVSRSVLRDGLFLLVLRLYRRRNVIVFFHGWDEKFFARMQRRVLWRVWFRMCFGGATHMLVLASAFSRSLQQLGIAPTKVQVITTMFDGETLRGQGHLSVDKHIRILFLARFIVEKGIYELLEAFRQVIARYPEAILVMAGDGPELSTAREWCSTFDLDEQVEFPGYVDGAGKAALLLSADIFVLPSYREGCPISLLEAMAAGLPVVASSTGAVPDIIRQDENGILLHSIDAESIADAILRLVSAKQLRTQMGYKNREKAWQNFEAKKVTGNIEVLYDTIITSTQ